MDECFAFWEASCSIDWSAWGAIGSMAAAIAAVAITLFNERKARKEKNETNSIILGQLYSEAKRILFVSEWYLDLERKIKAGALPDGFNAALNLAIKDVSSLNTQVYDLFASHIPQFRHRIAGVLIYQYSTIKTNLTAIEQTLQLLSAASPQKRFNKIGEHIAALQTSSFNIVEDLADILGYRERSDRTAGPESYSTWGLYERE